MSLLDNIFWHSLSGAQARFAEGAGGARRYAHGFSPILAFEDSSNPDFAALDPYCQAGERFYVDDWSGPVPPGWALVLEKKMKRMVWNGELPAEDETLGALPIQASHAPRAVELALLTNPGPFGLRTIELGDYFGVFEGDRLLAMAGERMQAGPYRELSGVCTHPDARGRGLARRLSEKVLGLQMRRGQLPFLHVISSNAAALALYEQMGFREYRETVVRVVERVA